MVTPRKIVVLEGYRVSRSLQGLYAIEWVLRELPALLISSGLVWDMNGSKVARSYVVRVLESPCRCCFWPLAGQESAGK